MVEGEYVPGDGYTLRERGGQAPRPPGEEYVGELQANDPVAGETVWRIRWTEGNNTPVMATGGDLVFQGGPNEGVVRAFDARTGDIVWTFRTGSNFRNSAITYIGPDGRQYVAIIGSQRTGSEPVTPDTEPDAGARFRRAGSALYVFALPPARN